LILQCQWRQFVGQREDEVKIGRWKKFLGSLGKPLLPRAELALRAMSIPARVVGDYAMAALVTQFDVTTEGRGAARADVAKGFMLLRGNRVSPLRQKLLLMFADDIGYFEPILAHLRRPSLSAQWGVDNVRRSRGLTVCWRACCETSRYLAVVLMLA
jgi:hypothetical protein